ncbi:MAG: P-loop NTPase [Propionibacteriaceae bacterium]|jgi:secretion/DNA translocation related CpaE-like protein|nr:P-loop NTPase [Propionibacteriaceae bacterium]
MRNENAQVLVVAESSDVQDLILSAAAAQDLSALATTDLDEICKAWSAVETIFVDEKQAEHLISRALPRREHVYLVGCDQKRLATWSTPLGAKVIILPDGIAWLGAVLDEGSTSAGGQVVALLGGSGGVGTSTLAACLALAAAKKKKTAALVDVDPLGGGIDLLLGAEAAAGWRWPRLGGAEGHVGDLREYLPKVEGVSVVSMARENPADLAKGPLTAIIQALRRTHDLVVIDAGRGLTGGSREAIRLAGRRLLVVAGTVRGIAAADQVIQAHGCPVEVVLRRTPGAAGDAGTVQDLLGQPVVATIGDDKAVALAADRGDLPWLSARRTYLRTCAKLVA